MTMPSLALIVAYARGRVIGHEGMMPWHEPKDLKHFKATTLGHPVIMGRKSYESIGRPLPGRLNLVLSRQQGYAAKGCTVVPDLDTALATARAVDDLPFICGGAVLYEAALPLCTRLHLTEIDREVPGDTFFPTVDESLFTEVDRRTDGHLTFRTLERR